MEQLTKIVWDNKEEKLNIQNNDLKNKRHECLNDFDKITELNNETMQKLNDLQSVTKNIIKDINALLNFCSLKPIENNVKAYKGLYTNSIKNKTLQKDFILLNSLMGKIYE